MSDTTQAILLGVLELAAAVWVGGLVAIAVVARAANRTVSRLERVVFFRPLERTYGVGGGVALIVALGTGAALVADRSWSSTLTAACVVAAALVAATAGGVAQTRRMTRLRSEALRRAGDELLTRRVRLGARRAVALRAAIGVLSLALSNSPRY